MNVREEQLGLEAEKEQGLEDASGRSHRVRLSQWEDHQVQVW